MKTLFRSFQLAAIAPACLLAAATITGCARTSRPAQAGYTLRVGFVGSGKSRILGGAEGWAAHTGLLSKGLRQQGVTDIQFLRFPNGPDLNEALAGGALDVGLLGDTPALVARGAGQPTHAIVQDEVGLNVWLIARKDGPHTLSELKGKTVAASKGSYMSRYLLGILQQQGLSQQVKFVHLLPSDAEAALTRGDIAAYAAPGGTGPLLLAHGFTVIDEAARHPGLTGSHVTVVPEKFLDAHPGFPAAWNQTRLAALSDLMAHPDQFYQFQADASGLPPAITRASFPLTLFHQEPFSPEGLALLDGTKTFLRRQGLLKTDFSLKQWTTT